MISLNDLCLRPDAFLIFSDPAVPDIYILSFFAFFSDDLSSFLNIVQYTSVVTFLCFSFFFCVSVSIKNN